MIAKWAQRLHIYYISTMSCQLVDKVQDCYFKKKDTAREMQKKKGKAK